MARLETQINQIYLSHPDAKKTSLILYEEALSAALNLFVVCELRGMNKKSEANDLKKISEIILTSFRINKKLPGETLFETALAQINQNLADLAHEGHKSWVGKFSCLIALKSSDNIFVANNGQTAAWLKRKSEMLEVLPSEKVGTHPLKTFQNFTQGKLVDSDTLILTTSNIFNYVSFSLFTKIISQNSIEDGCQEISKILQDSPSSDQAFSTFFITTKKKAPVTIVEPSIPVEEPKISVYAPLPEDVVEEPAVPILSKIPKVNVPKINFKLPSFIRRFKIPKIEFGYFQKLSPAGKFFFISFTIFIILFLVSLSVNGFKLRGQRIAESIEKQVEIVAEDIALAQSALIYKNDEQAFKYLAQAQADQAALLELSPEKAQEFVDELERLKNQINKNTIAQDPKIYAQYNRHPVYLAKNPQGFLLSALDSNSLSTSSGSQTQDIFVLNSLDQEITSIAHWPTLGTVVSVADKLYYINSTLKQFESFISLQGSEIEKLETYNNNLYALDTKNGRILRITKTSTGFSTQTANSGDYSQIRDVGIDGDFYLLSANAVTKVKGNAATAVPMPFMTEPITNATRIFVGNNLYILEPSKKRVVIISKTGSLINQISFPTTTTPLDLYIDEADRSLYLLDDNRLLRITF